MWDKIKTVAVGIVAGIIAALLIVLKLRTPQDAETQTGREAGERKRDEMQNMSDSDIVDSLPDPAAVRGAVDRASLGGSDTGSGTGDESSDRPAGTPEKHSAIGWSNGPIF